MEPIESYNFTDYKVDPKWQDAFRHPSSELLLSDAHEEAKPLTKPESKPAHTPGFLERIAAAKDRFFERIVGLPDVNVSKDHTAQIQTGVEYGILLGKTEGSLCTLFYRASDPQDSKLKDAVVELAKALDGKVTFALINSENSQPFVLSCGLSEKQPAFAIADKDKAYIHLYTRKADATNLKELIDRYERGEKRLED